ncbi:MAG TPA: hypothetical protein ENI19_02025 [Candidatus Nealsonbacteria bacterium]|uniref:General secretion pathway GspH domain-containing protein n=1 Tax=marine sediment metagenome TaxID=412755 RepID=A0A0F9VBM3_9ZZZZ|nr:hypothetical protein [Candidatus Nealsonbacteria bacterium]HEB46468.1 hypothetical protein [Candidatus Nealsonbacteria bacterium]
MMKSFTLIEVLVIIGIMVILMVLALPAYRSFQNELDLNNSTEEIINTLRIAQNKTLASEGASQYGVYFDQTTSPHQYTLFKGNDYASRNSSFDKIHKLPKSVEISDISLNGGESEIIFDRISGTTSQFGSLIIRLKDNPTKTKTVYIENSGQVGLTSPSTPSDAARIKDSRHVHFDLGWSIQSATLLKFYFPDIPQTEQVDMADYFNADKTEFDWAGIFIVDGIDQTFQVHTHSLDTFNLCIHRDRNQGRTNQEVIIYIVEGGVDKEIAHYLADVNDSVTEGPYGGTKEIQ